MRERFLDFIEKHALILSQERVLLAVSGGLDSMVMLELFFQCEIPFDVAHCNFDLRGAESDADEALVKDRAKGMGVTFFNKRFNTKAYASDKNVSIQMAARDLRYEWFDQLCTEEGYSKVASAHHLNDSLETVIHNLARGTSIAGLRGILPSRDNFIRPLIDFTRDEIEAWAVANDVIWREDASNQETYYKRNLIRHEVVKPLQGINPDLLQTFRNTLSRNREVETIFLAHVHQARQEWMEERGEYWYVLKSKMTGPYVLELLLKPFGFTYGQAQGIWSVREGLSGNQFITATHRLVVDREYLIISKLTGQRIETQLIGGDESELRIGDKLYDLQSLAVSKSTNDLKSEKHALLDRDKLSFPLTIRTWNEGDAFNPLGMKGKKKLSDFMIDRKIPVNLKSMVQVVESAGEIVWVVGMRIDDRYKITAKTKEVFCLIEKEIHV